MPSPKQGSVTDDVLSAVDVALKGEASVRCDKAGVVNAAVGKVSQGPLKILGNLKAVLEGINDMKPEGVKMGTKGYIQGCHLSRTIGKGCGGINVTINTVDATSVFFFRGGAEDEEDEEEKKEEGTAAA